MGHDFFRRPDVACPLPHNCSEQVIKALSTCSPTHTDVRIGCFGVYRRMLVIPKDDT